MKFKVKLSGKTLYTFMRQAGYAPQTQKAQAPELSFTRSLGGFPYPRFHVYATQQDEFGNIHLHVDQKRPSYPGSHAHSGEYDGPLVEQEAMRIQQLAR
jgi:hypothetical protein